MWHKAFYFDFPLSALVPSRVMRTDLLPWCNNRNRGVVFIIYLFCFLSLNDAFVCARIDDFIQTDDLVCISHVKCVGWFFHFFKDVRDLLNFFFSNLAAWYCVLRRGRVGLRTQLSFISLFTPATKEFHIFGKIIDFFCAFSYFPQQRNFVLSNIQILPRVLDWTLISNIAALFGVKRCSFRIDVYNSCNVCNVLNRHYRPKF